MTILLNICLLNEPVLSDENGSKNVKLLRGVVSNTFFPMTAFISDNPMDWTEHIIPALTTAFDGEVETYFGTIGITFNSDCQAELVLCSKPSCPSRIQKKFKNALELISFPRTKYGEYASLLYFTVNVDNPHKFEIPEDCPFDFPAGKRLREYRKMGLSDQYHFLIRWTRNELLPTLSHVFRNVDAKFEGVRTFADLLEFPEQLRGKFVSSLTDSSSLYWKARIEMVPGDNSILITKMLLYISQGRIDRAIRIIQIINLYEGKPSLATEYLHELEILLSIYLEKRNKIIKKGIAAFDSGDKDSAIDIYKNVIDSDSACAWAWHEYFLASGFSGALSESFRSEYNLKVYGADPLYPMGISAHTGVEAFHIGRRMEITELFKNSDSVKNDMVSFADIALDVNEFGMGAELYWQALPFQDSEKAERVIDGFLYCLEKLRVTDIKSIFVGNPDERFQRVEKASRNRMENSTMYKAMKKSGD